MEERKDPKESLNDMFGGNEDIKILVNDSLNQKEEEVLYLSVN